MSEHVSQTASPPIRVKGIDHVTLVVDDLERSKQFYCGILGMNCVERPGFDFPGMWFQAGATQIHLILKHAGSAPPGFPAPEEYVRPGRTFHFAFEVADGKQALSALEAHGVELKGSARMRPDGCFQVFCFDPDRHIVELFSQATTQL